MPEKILVYLCTGCIYGCLEIPNQDDPGIVPQKCHYEPGETWNTNSDWSELYLEDMLLSEIWEGKDLKIRQVRNDA
jgi:hypothetical protein